MAAALCVAALAGAQKQKDPAAELFKRAVEAFKAGDYAKAERLFLSSWDLAPRAATMCNLGLTYEKWGQREEQAIAAYEKCAEADDTGKYRPTALERAAALEQQRQAAAPAAAPAAPPSAATPAPAAAPARAETAVPAETPAAAPTPADPESPTRYWRWAALGAGTVALGAGAAGVLFVNRSNDTASQLDREFPDGMVPAGGEAEARLERAARDAETGKRLYIAAGVLAAASVTFLVLDLTLEVRPAPGGGMVTFVTRFR